MTGPERATLYDLALGTGFRADELATLTPERFALDSDPPTVSVLAGYANNGKEAIQPIAIALANRLRPWLARKAAGTRVFDGLTDRTAEMLRVDLEAAKIPYETAAGVADFHALRAAYVSNLVASGASVKTCQTLARHSTPSLTIGIYAKTSLHDIQGAVEKLPDPTPRDLVPTPVASPKSGPVPTPISMHFGHHLATAESVSIQGQSDACAILESAFEFPMDCNPMVVPGLDAILRDMSAADGNAPRRTRTYNPLIKSQLLSISSRGGKEPGCRELRRTLASLARCRFTDFTGIYQGFPPYLCHTQYT